MKGACCLAVLLTSAIGNAADRKLKVDRFGDPLPAGAVHRLGTTRFRHFGDAMSIEYSADGKFLAASSKAGSVFIWESSTGRVILSLPKTPSGPIQGDFEHFPFVVRHRDLGHLFGAESVSARRHRLFMHVRTDGIRWRRASSFPPGKSRLDARKTWYHVKSAAISINTCAAQKSVESRGDAVV